MLNKQGEVERLLGINMDMTEVKQLNEALFQEKERLHITLDSIGEAVLCTDIDMNITFMNPVAEKMSGWSQSEALGQPVLKVLHITFGENGPLMENIHSGDMSRTDIEQDVVLNCRNGGSFDIHYSITRSAPRRARYRLGAGDSGCHRVAQNAAPAELQRFP